MSHIQNYMENIVDDCIGSLMKELGVCDCEICKLDLKAKALNKLPPQYFLTHKGEMFMKINVLKVQFEADVVAAVTEAAVYIKNNPNPSCKKQNR